jgi:hypothetical protein
VLDEIIIQKILTSIAKDSLYSEIKNEYNDKVFYSVDFLSGNLLLYYLLKNFKEETQFKKSFKEYIDENTPDIVDLSNPSYGLYYLTQVSIDTINDNYHIYPENNLLAHNMLIYLFKVWIHYHTNSIYSQMEITDNDFIPENYIVSIPLPLNKLFYETDVKTINWNILIDKFMLLSRDPSLLMMDNNINNTNFIKFSNMFIDLMDVDFNNLDSTQSVNLPMQLTYNVYYNNGLPLDIYKNIETNTFSLKDSVNLINKLDFSFQMQIILNNSKSEVYIPNSIYSSGINIYLNNAVLNPLYLWYNLLNYVNLYKLNNNSYATIISKLSDIISDIDLKYVIKFNDNKNLDINIANEFTK